MTVRLHIGRLVVEGLDVRPDQARRMTAAIEAELGRVVSARDAASGFGTDRFVRDFRSPAIVETGDKSPESVGRQIARAMHGAIVG